MSKPNLLAVTGRTIEADFEGAAGEQRRSARAAEATLAGGRAVPNRRRRRNGRARAREGGGAVVCHPHPGTPTAPRIVPARREPSPHRPRGRPCPRGARSGRRGRAANDGSLGPGVALAPAAGAATGTRPATAADFSREQKCRDVAGRPVAVVSPQPSPRACSMASRMLSTTFSQV
jgi:hypothetical protein